MPPFRVLTTKRIYDGRVVNLRLDTLDIGDGKSVTREIVEHRGAIVVAAIDPEGRVLLVRQYRHPAGQTLLELPAGTLEVGEDPMVTATRELQEETGFYPGSIKKVAAFYSAPGFCTEVLHLYVAGDLRPHRLQGDDDEDIEVVPMELPHAIELVLSGEIKDAKSIAGLLLVKTLSERA